jgi:CBS domain-containing protein
MRTVRDVMSGDIEVLRTTESVADAASYLAVHELDSIPLCQTDGSLAGAISNRDIVVEVVAKGRDPHEVRLSELVGPATPLSLDVDVTVEEAVSFMSRHRRARLPVVDGNRVVGSVTQRDVARSVVFRAPWDDGLT